MIMSNSSGNCDACKTIHLGIVLRFFLNSAWGLCLKAYHIIYTQNDNETLSRSCNPFISILKWMKYVEAAAYIATQFLLSKAFKGAYIHKSTFEVDHNLSSKLWSNGGDQFVALLRWYGNPGFFDSGLQLICIFWSLVSHFPLVWWVCWPVKHTNTIPWSFNQLLVLLAVWAGAKSCWKMKSATLKSWSAEGSMKCSKMYW